MWPTISPKRQSPSPFNHKHTKHSTSNNNNNNKNLSCVNMNTYPVEIHYLSAPTVDWQSLALHFVKHICNNMPAGNILLFVPTTKTAEQSCHLLNKELGGKLVALPLYKGLPEAEQQRAFSSSAGIRKCVTATNIAENLSTIGGFVYVIDTGIFEKSGYNPRGDMKTLRASCITQTSAEKRASQAGRIKPGTCFRLYTEQTFLEDFAPDVEPEIKSTSFLTTCLEMMAEDLDVINFEFVYPPDMEVFLRAISELKVMEYINDHGKITDKGRKAALLPHVQPMWWNVIEEGQKLGCCTDMISLAVIAGTQESIFLRPWKVRTAADAARARFACPTSDHVAQLNALHAYSRVKSTAGMDLKQWCFDAFIDPRAMETVLETRQELHDMVQAIMEEPLTTGLFDDEYDTNIAKALARGLVHNIAFHEHSDIYMTVHDNFPTMLSADSCLVSMEHEWVVFNSIFHVRASFLKIATAVKPEWLIDLPFFQDDKLSRKRTGTLRKPLVKESLDAARARNLP
ncbi:hypothetical protein FSHL1_000691 [Fusarium sambucinum]